MGSCTRLVLLGALLICLTPFLRWRYGHNPRLYVSPPETFALSFLAPGTTPVLRHPPSMEEQYSGLKPGGLWPSIPWWMFGYEPYRIAVAVGKGADARKMEEQIKALLRDREVGQRREIRVDNSVDVWLTADDDVTIDPQTPRKQVLLEGKPALWEWKVTPNKRIGRITVTVRQSVDLWNPRTNAFEPSAEPGEDYRIWVVPDPLFCILGLAGIAVLWVLNLYRAEIKEKVLDPYVRRLLRWLSRTGSQGSPDEKQKPEGR